MKRLNIIYRGFWDVPRMFITAFEGRQYLFDCKFDDNLDDYPNGYRVYELPAITESQLNEVWDHLSNMAVTFIGVVPVASIQFDPTRRLNIDAAVFDEILAAPGRHSPVG